MWLEHKIGSVCHPIGSIGGTTFAFFAMLVESACPVCGGGDGFIQAGSRDTGRVPFRGACRTVRSGVHEVVARPI